MAASALGERVWEARSAHGWSRATLAKRAGVSPSSVARIELYGAVPLIATLRPIADALGLSLGALLDEHGDAA